MKYRSNLITGVFLLSLIMTGCGQIMSTGTSQPDDKDPSSVAGDRTPTPAETGRPSPSLTPTSTPRPTGTAIPVSIRDELYQLLPFPPTPNLGAPCGWVDTLDFPLDPPDGLDVAFGGQDFGVHRPQFRGHHTGEDWWGPAGRGTSFGIPVYAIGHGTVTYAEPNGWGRDKGVIIIQHVFPDGSKVFSFYGHLDPSSVDYYRGECVVRGEQIGRIGDPRQSPHLHFEIRTHSPTIPEPGYWPVDPTLSGWKPPSQFIWEYRMRTSPPVDWLWSPEDDLVKSIGTTNNGSFVLHTESTIMGVNTLDGSLSWSHPLTHRLIAAVVDAQFPIIYTFDSGSELKAYRFKDAPEGGITADSENFIENVWTTRLDSSTTPILLPLPSGGVALFSSGRFTGYSADGAILWGEDPFARPYDWVTVDDDLVLTTSGRDGAVWTIGADGPTAWGIEISGHLGVLNGSIWVYSEQGVFRLTPGLSTIQPIHTLPEGFIRLGDIVALPGIGILLDHTDLSDRRIILLDDDGDILWQRSYTDLLQGQLHLFKLGGQSYLMSLMKTSAADVYAFNTSSVITIYSIDVDNGDLTWIFSGGTRHPDPDDFTLHPIDDQHILINIGGTSLVSLDLSLTSE